jgi:hypothetical protein
LIGSGWQRIFDNFNPVQTYDQFVLISFQKIDLIALKYIEEKKDKIIEQLAANENVEMAHFVPGAVKIFSGIFDMACLIGLRLQNNLDLQNEIEEFTNLIRTDAFRMVSFRITYQEKNWQ